MSSAQLNATFGKAVLAVLLGLTWLTLPGCESPKPSAPPDAKDVRPRPDRPPPRPASSATRANAKPPPGSPAHPNLARRRFPVVTPINPVLGQVVSLNALARFVVVDFSFHALPRAGQRLNVYRGDQKLGEVRISGAPRNGLMAADVLAGEPQTGDEVREE